MRGRRLRLLPLVLFGLTLAVEIGAVLLPFRLGPGFGPFLFRLFGVVLAGGGRVVIAAQARDVIGLVVCVAAFGSAVMADAAQGWALRAAEEGWRGGDAAA